MRREVGTGSNYRAMTAVNVVRKLNRGSFPIDLSSNPGNRNVLEQQTIWKRTVMKHGIFCTLLIFATRWVRDVRVGNSHIIMTWSKLHGIRYNWHSDCLSRSVIRLTAKEVEKLHLADHFNGVHWLPVDFPHQEPNDAESVSTSWRQNQSGIIFIGIFMSPLLLSTTWPSQQWSFHNSVTRFRTASNI